MPFLTRPHFEDRQIVQYGEDVIKLSGTTKIAPTILDFSGTTTGETAVTINTLTGYLNGQRLSGLVVEPAQLRISGSTGTTKQNVTGFVLQSIDPYGSVEWAPISGVSWSVSACTSPLYVSTIEACPNPTDPIYITAGNVQFGASPSLIADITNTKLGIGTGSPSERLHVEGGDLLVQNTSGSFSTDIQNSAGTLALLSGSSTDLARFGVKVPTYDSVTFGVRGGSEPTFPGYGKQGDAFIYSSQDNNGFNIISQPGTGTDDYVRFFVGQAAGASGTADLYIQGSGSTRGNIGINNESPTEKLHIISAVEANIKVEADTGNVDETDNANILLTQDGGVSTARFGMSPDGDNHLLIGVNSTSVPSIKFATRSDGTSFSTTADTKVTISNAGNVGIGTETPTEKLHVEGGNILVGDVLDGRVAVTIDNFSVSNDAFSALRVCVSGSSLPACAYGVVSAYGPDASPTGSFGGSYLPNSLTIATSNNAQPDRLHINIGSRRAGDAQTRFFGGSDDFDSSSLLGVFYTSGLTITDTLNTDTLRVRDGATSGYVLTSDAQGNASWQPSTSGGTGGGVTIDPYNDVGTTTTINWDVSGTSTNYEATLNGNGTLNLLNVRNGDYGTIIVEQDGVGGHTLAFGTINGGAGTHKVVNGGSGAPTLTVNANAIDILSFTYNGSTMYWTVGNDYT